MSALAIEINDLHAWYGESHILHGINFSVKAGEVVTLLGRNGAGRTSTLRAILGLTGKRTGSIRIHGHEVIHLPTHQIAHLGIGYCPEERGIFSTLTAQENLLLPPVIADTGMSIQEIYEMFPNLYERRNSPGTRVSGGEQQMLALARILRTFKSWLRLLKLFEVKLIRLFWLNRIFVLRKVLLIDISLSSMARLLKLFWVVSYLRKLRC